MKQKVRTLFNTIRQQFATEHQRTSFATLIAGFLHATGNPKPEHASVKSAPALSRFLNQYAWNTRSLIRLVRAFILEQLWNTYDQRRGRRPVLEIMLDLTTLEKTGAFPALDIHALKDKIGLHLVVLYIVIGAQRFPWSFLVWRGKHTASPTQLGLKLLQRLPAWWSERFTVRVLADSGFDSNAFIDGMHALGLHGVIGSRENRGIGQGKHLHDLRCRGSQVQFKACQTPVFASWFYLKRARGERVWRYVISTRAADGETIKRWGKRRWRIEAFFKTMKFRFGLDQFGQRSARGAFRFLILALLAFVLSFYTALEAGVDLQALDWGGVARGAREALVPEVVAQGAWLELRRLKPILEARGVTCWTTFV